MRRSLFLLLACLAAACAHRPLAPAVAAGAVPSSAVPAPPAPVTSPAPPPAAPGPTTPPRAATAAAQPRGGAPEGAAAEVVGQPAPSLSPPASVAEARARLVSAARHHLGRPFRGDCSGFVLSIYAEAGVVLPALKLGRTMSESLFRSLSQVVDPMPGDLAFFHSTRRRDRRAADPERLTHVAVVELVEGPRVVLIHRESKGIRRLAMNLERPHDPSENGIVRRRWARSASPGLAGELFAGYATALRREPPAVASLVEFAPGS